VACFLKDSLALTFVLIYTGGGKITPERIARLEAIGFEWDPQKAQWNQMFEKLQTFAADLGHCKVPKVRSNLDYYRTAVGCRNHSPLTPNHQQQLLVGIQQRSGISELGSKPTLGTCQYDKGQEIAHDRRPIQGASDEFEKLYHWIIVF
jgi:hypothetical protein